MMLSWEARVCAVVLSRHALNRLTAWTEVRYDCRLTLKFNVFDR